MDRKVQRESSEYIYELVHATSVALATDPLDAGIYSLHEISSDAAQVPPRHCTWYRAEWFFHATLNFHLAIYQLASP